MEDDKMRLIRWLDENFELAVLAVLLAVMSVLSFVNVIMRYCFKNALSWSDEVCCYCLALSAFFALSCAVRQGANIRVAAFVTLLSPKTQKILEIICSVIMLGFLAVLLAGTGRIAATSAGIGQKSPALRLPVAGLYGTMAFAVALSMFRYVQFIWRTVIKKEEEDEK